MRHKVPAVDKAKLSAIFGGVTVSSIPDMTVIIFDRSRIGRRIKATGDSPLIWEKNWLADLKRYELG
jgi:hypothetical protein